MSSGAGLDEVDQKIADLISSRRTVRFLIEYRNLSRAVPIIGTLEALDEERGVLTIKKRGSLGPALIYMSQIRNWDWEELNAD